MTDVGSARVLAVVADPASREVVTKVIPHGLVITEELGQAVALAESHRPDIAFVEVGLQDGAGLALVHHLKAVLPRLAVYALASRRALDTAANAVALGGAGLIIMPPGGDEILSAVEAVRDRLRDEALRSETEAMARNHAILASWAAAIGRVAEAPTRASAASQLLDAICGSTSDRGPSDGAVYLRAGGSSFLLVAATDGLLDLPRAFAEEALADLLQREHLQEVPVTIGGVVSGHVCLRGSTPLASPDMAALFSSQVSLALSIAGERERSGGAAIKDPGSSAYSFAYYVDVAGREIARAERYSRRFAIATIAFDRADGDPPMTHAEMADQILKAARDTDVLAHVEEHEFQLLMPETDGLGAHAARRRVLTRIAERVGRLLPDGLRIGFATYPHDGTDLSRLLRVARRRAEATRYSLVRRFAPDQSGLSDLLDAIAWDLDAPEPEATFAARRLELPVTDAAALGGAVVTDALRGGGAIIVLAANDKLGLGSAVKAALPPPRENLTLHVVDVRASARCGDLEAVAILAEHGTYALVGRNERGVVHGIHAADPLLADVLAERLGRAAGLRLLT